MPVNHDIIQPPDDSARRPHGNGDLGTLQAPVAQRRPKSTRFLQIDIFSTERCSLPC